MITIVGDDQTELAPISHLNLSSSFMAKPKVINSNLTPDPKIQEELLNLKIRVKQKVINAIVNTRSQTNLISTSLVQKLRLETTPHSKPYPLGWIHKDVEMRIDYQCTFKFTITDKYIDEVTTEVVPLDMSSFSKVHTYRTERPSTTIDHNNICSNRTKRSSS